MASIPSRAEEQPDRRGGARPATGNTRPCPECKRGILEFNERYRESGRTLPGWQCDQCPHREFVRAVDVRLLVRQAREVQARAKRAIMTSTARRERSEKRMSRTQERISKSRRRK